MRGHFYGVLSCYTNRLIRKNLSRNVKNSMIRKTGRLRTKLSNNPVARWMFYMLVDVQI